MALQNVKIKSSEFQPKADNILVKPIELESEKVTDTGIVFEINANKGVADRPTMGTIVAIGKEVEDVSEGTEVFWPVTDGIDFEFTDGTFTLLRYESIIGSKRI